MTSQSLRNHFRGAKTHAQHTAKQLFNVKRWLNRAQRLDVLTEIQKIRSYIHGAHH